MYTIASAHATTTSSASARRPPTVRSGFTSRFPEPVADAANGENELGVRGIGLELLAQVAHVDVDRARVAKVRAAPQCLEQHPPAVDAPGMRHQRPQDLELDVRQLNERVRE